jgi:hypothetical protein
MATARIKIYLYTTNHARTGAQHFIEQTYLHEYATVNFVDFSYARITG